MFFLNKGMYGLLSKVKVPLTGLTASTPLNELHVINLYSEIASVSKNVLNKRN